MSQKIVKVGSPSTQVVEEISSDQPKTRSTSAKRELGRSLVFTCSPPMHSEEISESTWVPHSEGNLLSNPVVRVPHSEGEFLSGCHCNPPSRLWEIRLLLLSRL